MRLSLRVVLLTSLAVGAVALLLNVLTYVLVKHELYSRLDSTLRDRVLLLSPEVRAELTGGRTLGVIARSGRVHPGAGGERPRRSCRRTR